MMEDERQLLTLHEVSKILFCSVLTIRRLIAAGKLPIVWSEDRSRYYVDFEDLERFKEVERHGVNKYRRDNKHSAELTAPPEKLIPLIEAEREKIRPPLPDVRKADTTKRIPLGGYSVWKSKGKPPKPHVSGTFDYMSLSDVLMAGKYNRHLREDRRLRGYKGEVSGFEPEPVEIPREPVEELIMKGAGIADDAAFCGGFDYNFGIDTRPPASCLSKVERGRVVEMIFEGRRASGITAILGLERNGVKQIKLITDIKRLIARTNSEMYLHRKLTSNQHAVCAYILKGKDTKYILRNTGLSRRGLFIVRQALMKKFKIVLDNYFERVSRKK